MRLPEIDRLCLVSLVDNYVDALLKDKGPAKRQPRKARGAARACAEHGVAWAVESAHGNQRFALLFDFGATPLVYLHNLELLLRENQLGLADMRALVLSHGHMDHYGGLIQFLEDNRPALRDDVRLYAGADAFLHRWRAPPQGEREDMGQLDENFITGKGIGIVKVVAPQVIGDQALLSGEIPRVTTYESTGLPHARVTKGDKDVVDMVEGEQALVYHLRGKGLVVITGCAHAGVVNTVLHVREITGVDKVHAIIGGFHLSGQAEERIEETVEDLLAFNPEVIVPMHCTGIPAIAALDHRLGRHVIYNSAGTHYDFQA